jgi:hypothetical protein
MNFTAYYIDDQAHPQTIEANTAEMAAWRFLQQRPRTDTSQITVDSHPSVPWRSSATTHFRACDLINNPAPTDEAEPELAIRLSDRREPSYVVSGSVESLRILGTRLLRCLDEFPTRPNPLGLKHVFGVFVVSDDGFRRDHFLSFEADPDIQQHWARQLGLHGFWSEYGRFLFQLLFAAFACIGVWTVARWIF